MGIVTFAPLSIARCQILLISFEYTWIVTGEPTRVASAASEPGKISARKMSESPTWTDACMILSGPAIWRLVSLPWKTFLYHSIARAASFTARYGVTVRGVGGLDAAALACARLGAMVPRERVARRTGLLDLDV